MRETIKTTAEKIDSLVDWRKISSKIENKWVRFFVAALETVDGQIFKVCLTEIVDALPEQALPVAQSWMESFIAEDYLLLVDSTGAFLAELDLLKFLPEEKEKEVYKALLTMLVKLVPPLTQPEAA